MKKTNLIRLLVLVGVFIASISQMRADQYVWNAWVKCNFNGSAKWSDGDGWQFNPSMGTGSLENLGTLTSGDFTITDIKWKIGHNWGSWPDYAYAYMWYNINDGASQNSSGQYFNDPNPSGSYPYTSGMSWKIASYTDNSGIYTFKCGFYAHFHASKDDYQNADLNNSGNGYKFTYSVAPPDVSDFTVTPSGSIHGDGSSGNPYIVVPGNDLTLTLSGATQAHSDANSVAHYSVDGSSYGTASSNYTKTISNVTNTSNLSVTVYAKFYNSSANLNGEIKGKTIYYKADPHYNVTATYGAGGTSATPASATSTGQYEGRSISASAALGYYFTGWTVSSGSATFADAGSASTTVYPSANATVQANFSPIWYLKGAFDSWSDTHPISLASSTSGSVDLTTTTAKLANQEFKIWNKQTNTYYQIANKAIDRAHPTPSGSWTSGGTGNGMRFTSDIITTYTFALTFSSNIPSGISVTYPAAYTVTFGQGTGYGTAVTASATSAGGSFSSGDYVAAGEDVTFTQLAHAGYSFEGWYTAASGGTAVTGMGKSDNVLDNISANANVYAQYSPITYEITFDATTNGGSISDEGDTSDGKIDATYDAAVSGTMPTALKDGRHFAGWYTAASLGLKVINADGTWNTVTGYTDASKNWIHADDATLYAHYNDPQILSISFSPVHAMPRADVTVTVSFFNTYGDPEGDFTLCYKLTTAEGVALQAQPEWRSKNDAAHTVTFTAPSSPGDYSLEVKLLEGLNADCSGDYIARKQGGPDFDKFDVEEMNPITITYECGGVELRESTTIYATWNNRATVTAPSIPGMNFDHWEYTNCTIEGGAAGTYSGAEATFYAFTAGSAKAVYTQGSLFFKDTKNWVVNPETDSIYIYFYNSTTGYWHMETNKPEGTGSKSDDPTYGSYFIKGPIAMSLLEGTDDVYYFDEEKNGTLPSYSAVAFTKEKMKGYQFFAGEEATTKPCHVVYVNAFDSNKPMIVPVGNGALWNQKYAMYYSHDLAPLLQDWGATVRFDIDSWVATHKLKSAKMGDLSFSTKIYLDRKSYNQQWRVYDGSNSPYGKNGTPMPSLTYSSPTSETLVYNEGNQLIKTNLPGEYIFTVTYGTATSSEVYSGAATSDGLWKHATVTVTYPVEVGDYRLVYDDSNLNPHPSDIIKKENNGESIVSMFYNPLATPVLTIQNCSIVATNLGDDVDPITWSTPTTIDLSSYSTVLTEAGVYNFTITLDANGINPEVTNVEKYSGRFYVRTDCVNSDKWNYKNSKDAHAMTYSDYSTTLTTKPFSHYYVKDIDGGSSNVKLKFTVATDYSEAITDTVINGDASGDYKDMWGAELLTRLMNVRFTYNQKTNKIWRAYTEGPQLTGYMTLRCNPGANELKDPNPDPVIWKSNGGTQGSHQDTLKFADMGNWVYQLDAFGDPGVYVKLTADIRDNTGATITQYIKGIKKADVTVDADRAYNKDSAELLIGGSGDAQHMRIIYDFKTDRMTTAWIPAGTVSADLSIHADVMLIRREQEGASSIVIGTKAGSSAYATLTDVEKAYGVMEFRKSYINNVSYSRYERNLYWISFPFDVKLSDVFGFGKYGEHWIIECYDGKSRAQNGFWAESEPNWKFVTEEVKDEYILKANEGYILALALSNMGNSSSVWESGRISSVYLYFPSKDNIGNITNRSTYDMPLDSAGYKCKITRDHRDVKDSYWHCIGVPSYGLNRLTGVSTTEPNVETEKWTTPYVPYVYKWDSVYNTLSIASSSTFTFEAMKSYLIQYADDHITWTNVTNKSAIVARDRENRGASFYEWNLNLLYNGEHKDHTYVRLTNDENATDGYDFGNDLSKEFNSGSNIYTFVDDIEVAGNVKPICNQTTVVQVGVKITADGEYTFAMPEGTNGVGAVLIDNIAGTRTNLALDEYTVSLESGTINGRFFLEISPIANTPTDVDNVQSDNVQGTVRKVMVDGIMYIVKDGKVFDAQGNRVR